MMLSTTIDRSKLLSQPDEALAMLAEIRAQVELLHAYYPDFDSWFNYKVCPQLLSGERAILVEQREGTLAGFAIVKDDIFEQKLCCLRVMPSFQNSRGLGLCLFERAFDVLDTTKPLLSVSEEMLPKYHRIFNYFGFEIAGEYEGYYRPSKLEFSVNGLLDSSLILPGIDRLHQKKAA